MIQLLTCFFIFLIFPAISEEPHHTTAYIDAPGNTDLLFSYSYDWTRYFWNKYGEKLPTYNDFDRHAFFLYAEYAFNPCNSFSFNGGYAMVTESLNGNAYSFQDMELGWKHLMYKGKTSAFTLQLVGIIPPGAKKSSIRYGTYGTQVSLLYSDVFYLKNLGWYDLDIGYRYYHGTPANRLLLNTSVGYYLTSRLALIATSQLDYGLSERGSKYLSNNIVFHPTYRLLNLQIEGVLRVYSHVSLVLGAFKHLWGRHVGTNGGLFGGAWFDF